MESPGPQLIDALLGTTDPDAWADMLARADMLAPGGLERLLDEAARLVRDDPARGRELATRCAALAPRAAAPAAAARGAYIQAQAHAVNAEYDAALALIDAAHAGYTALGQTLAALRTNIGRMNVLRELGRYEEGLSTGREALATLATLPSDQEESELLAAMAHQNCGNCYNQLGLYHEALQSYAAAEVIYRTLALDYRLGEINNNRGVVLLGLGRARESLTAFEQAATFFAGCEETVLQGQALINCGNAHMLLGRYTEALAVFEQARLLFEPLDSQADKAVLLLDTAAAYLALNFYPEALDTYRVAFAQLAAANMPYEQARALWGAGSVLLAEGRLAEAVLMLEQAATLFAQTNNVPLQASVLLEQSALHDSQGNRALALQTAQAALALVANNDWPVEQIYAHLRLADLLLPDFDQAETHLRAARRLITTVTLPQLRYRLNQRLGNLRRLQSNGPEAERLLLSAVATIEELRGRLGHEALRVSFLRDKVSVYDDLLRLYLECDGVRSITKAFEINERARSRALLDLLQRRKSQPQAGGSGISTQMEILQADLHGVYDELLGGMTGQHYRVDTAELRARALELEQELSRLRLQAAATATPGDPLGTPLALKQILDRLPEDTALLVYHMLGQQLVAFVASGGELQVVGPFGSLPQVQVLLQRLEAQWDRVRAGAGFVNQHAALLEQATMRVLQALYNELLLPIRPLMEQQDQALQRLAIVPHGLLHRVPFHALYDGERYLLERYEVAYGPSASVWTLCQERQPRQTGRSLALGLANGSLPAVAHELAAVAAHLPGATVYLNEGATLNQLWAGAAHADVLHLACHGQFREDNPAFSGLQLHDGWLTAGEALELKLEGALVTLSACETGRGHVQSGDELIGLTRAFLGAGAATLLASLWLADDSSTAELMAAFYARLAAGTNPAAALRVAQLHVKQQQPHPFFWAAFVAVGRW